MIDTLHTKAVIGADKIGPDDYSISYTDGTVLSEVVEVDVETERDHQEELKTSAIAGAASISGLPDTGPFGQPLDKTAMQTAADLRVVAFTNGYDLLVAVLGA